MKKKQRKRIKTESYLVIRQVIQDEYDKNPVDTNFNFISRFAKAVNNYLSEKKKKQPNPQS